jgi:hypothetical protein
MQNNELATKQDLSELKASIKEELADVVERLFASQRELESRLNEKIERIETTLLTEFHKWVSPQAARQRTHSAALRAIDLEMEQLDERLTKVERGDPPPAH